MKNVFEEFHALTREGSRFDETVEKNMPSVGEGDTLLSQTVTAINRIVYRYYNDGDFINGAINSTVYNQANWLDNRFDELREVFSEAEDITNDDKMYVKKVLIPLIEFITDCCVLEKLEGKERSGSIYDCDGRFYNNEVLEDEDDEWCWDDEEDC